MNRSEATSIWQRLYKRLQPGPVGTHKDPEEAVRLASAVLLVEIARADTEHSQAERDLLSRQLQDRFGLQSQEAEALLTVAEQTADRSISLHEHVTEINTALDYSQKQSVLRMLWQVAYADGQLHHHEEHLLRRIADLLHLPHSDFIRAKLQVLGEV